MVSFYGSLCGPYAPPGCRELPADERGRRESRLGALPPLLMLIGDADPNLPEARRVHDAVRRANGRVEMFLYPGAEHMFDLRVSAPDRYDGSATRDAWEQVYRFLAEHLGD